MPEQQFNPVRRTLGARAAMSWSLKPSHTNLVALQAQHRWCSEPKACPKGVRDSGSASGPHALQVRVLDAINAILKHPLLRPPASLPKSPG